MENLTLVNTTVTFENKKLNKATKDIFKIGAQMKKELFKVADILAKVDEENLAETANFKNTAEYAMKTFGYGKSMAYTLIRIGKEFSNGNGGSLLSADGEPDYTVTQIEKLLPLKEFDKIVEVTTDGTVTPFMSAKEIEKKVKELTKPETCDEPCTQDESETCDEPCTQDEPEEVDERGNHIATAMQAISELIKMAQKADNDEEYNKLISMFTDLGEMA